MGGINLFPLITDEPLRVVALLIEQGKLFYFISRNCANSHNAGPLIMNSKLGTQGQKSLQMTAETFMERQNNCAEPAEYF
jgi:hypothetical protein